MMKFKKIGSRFEKAYTLPWLNFAIPTTFLSTNFPWREVQFALIEQDKYHIFSHFWCVDCKKYMGNSYCGNNINDTVEVPKEMTRLIVGCKECKNVQFAISGFKFGKSLSTQPLEMWVPG